MESQQLIVDYFDRAFEVLGKALAGLNQDDLNKQPHPDCATIGWITWHMSRVLDRWLISTLTGEEQLWVSDGWHAKFRRPAEPEGTGWHHSSQDLAAFESPDVQTLLQYHRTVLERSKRCVASLSAADLNRPLRESDSPFQTIGERLVGIISENLQHTGQVAYLRGLLKGKGWSDW